MAQIKITPKGLLKDKNNRDKNTERIEEENDLETLLICKIVKTHIWDP